jgi:hypothetical protein
LSCEEWIGGDKSKIRISGQRLLKYSQVEVAKVGYRTVVEELEKSGWVQDIFWR